MSPYIVTHSGRLVDLVNPGDHDFDISAISHSLAKQCRFTGHTMHIDEHYSVAQHSVMVANLCSPEHQLCGLMHDATEAYLGDVSSPLKALLPEYKRLEANMWRWIASRFNLPLVMPAEVRQADLVMLATERRDLMPYTTDRWPVLDGIRTLPGPIVPWSARRARDAFMSKFCELINAREAANVQ